jgi:molybdenum cofactor cytidylyltransferase
VIAGVILAAGSSQRLGRPKQLLMWRGRPLLQHVIEAAAASNLTELVVVLGHEADRISDALSLPGGARLAHNPDYRNGQASSLRVGLTALSGDSQAAAILLSDNPFVTAAVIDRVLEEFDRSAAPVVRPTFGGVPGHPVVVARSEWERWKKLTGDEGGRALLREAHVRELPLDGVAFTDVDTWDDYHALVERD